MSLAISCARGDKANTDTVAEATRRKDPHVDVFGCCGVAHLGGRVGLLMV